MTRSRSGGARKGSAWLLFAWLALSAGPAQAQSEATIGTARGEVYPDFLLPRLRGSMERLSNHRGKKVLLFHFASW